MNVIFQCCIDNIRPLFHVLTHIKPVNNLTFGISKVNSNMLVPFNLGLSAGSLLQDQSFVRIIFLPMRAALLAHIIILDSFVLIMCGEEDSINCTNVANL
jgi:hypothetical protein